MNQTEPTQAQIEYSNRIDLWTDLIGQLADARHGVEQASGTLEDVKTYDADVDALASQLQKTLGAVEGVLLVANERRDAARRERP